MNKIIVPVIFLTLTLITGFDSGCRTRPSEPLPPGYKGKAITALIETLRRDSSPTVKAAAALSLGELNCKYADQALIAALWQDQNYNVKLAAIKALGMIGGKRALNSLTEYKKFLKYPDLEQEIDAAIVNINQQGKVR